MNKIVSIILLIGSITFHESHSFNRPTYTIPKPYYRVTANGELYENYVRPGGAHGGRWMSRRIYNPTPEQIESLSEEERNRLTEKAPKKRGSNNPLEKNSPKTSIRK